MKNKPIYWAAHVTQMGGFAIGAENVLGEPRYITSIGGFEKQDNYFKKYGKNIKYIEDNIFIEKMDIVITNPPCAGLSRLTSNNTSIDKKTDLNNLTIKITKQCIDLYKPEIIIGESAEGLFLKSGEDIYEKLKTLAIENGYMISLYRTDTKLHGLPQSRRRTFYIFWKGDYSYKIGNISHESKCLKDTLDFTADSKEINPILTEDWAYRFIKDGLKINPRDIVKNIISSQKNVFQYILEKDLFDECIEFYKNEPDIQKKIIKIKDKKLSGKNVILTYPRFWDNIINGITWKNMNRSMHPVFDRSLNIREALTLMGFPKNYPEVNLKDSNLIGKNVPVNTAETLIKKIIYIYDNDNKINDHIKEDNIEYNKNIIDDW